MSGERVGVRLDVWRTDGGGGMEESRPRRWCSAFKVIAYAPTAKL